MKNNFASRLRNGIRATHRHRAQQWAAPAVERIERLLRQLGKRLDPLGR